MRTISGHLVKFQVGLCKSFCTIQMVDLPCSATLSLGLREQQYNKAFLYEYYQSYENRSITGKSLRRSYNNNITRNFSVLQENH